MPGKSVPDVGISNIDKLVHLAMFSTLTQCFYFEYSRHKNRLPHFIYTLLVIGMFGLLTEVLQLFADSRAFDLKDLAADITGVLVVSSLFVTLRKNL